VQLQASSGDVELLVIDGNSTDATAAIARDMGARVVLHRGALLGARRRGLAEAGGDIVVLLDSDQILRPGALAAAAELIAAGYGMVVLGERVWAPRSLVDRLSDWDKQLLAMDVKTQLNPRRGVLLARVYRREVLEAGFAAIPPSLDDTCIAHDHAIIYFECFKESSKVGYVPDAVWHIEPSSLLQLWRKNYRYGWSTRNLLAMGVYRDLIRDKTRRREIVNAAPIGLRVASLGFLSLKALAYFSGYAVGHRRR
jgi:glycosyltransferase involved in cell wall biosynthesis